MTAATDTRTNSTDVPEHDEDHPVTSSTPTVTLATLAPTGNAAYAPAELREQVTLRLAELVKDGWTQPAIKDITGFTISAIWRARHDKVHTRELEHWARFFEAVREGTYQPPNSGKKLKVEDLQSRVQEALDVLGNEAKTVKQYKTIVDAVQEILADLVPAPEATEDEADTNSDEAPAEAEAEATATA